MVTDAGDVDGDGLDDPIAKVYGDGEATTDETDTEFRPDTDGDGIPDDDEVDSDPALADTDEDGVPDAEDNCPGVPNPDQKDSDGDGDGELDSDEVRDGSNPNDEVSTPEDPTDGIDNDQYGVIDENTDKDDDRVDDMLDNCPFAANPWQSDFDGDSEGDACDLDDRLLLFEGLTPETVSWQGDVAYATTNLYRGFLDELWFFGAYIQVPGGNPYAEWFCDLPVPSIEDDIDPAPADVIFWLVSGNHVDEGESGIGADSTGAERPVDTSCHLP